MKKVLFILSLLSMSFAFAACGDSDDNQQIGEDELPPMAQTFIAFHFPGEKGQYEKDNNSYDVYLKEYKVEFELDGTWDSVDGKRNGQKNEIPESIQALLPTGILAYMMENYPDAIMLEVDKEAYGYEITLDKDVELQFDRSGSFIKKDK